MTLAAECRRVWRPVPGTAARGAAALRARNAWRPERCARGAGLTELRREHEAGLAPGRAGPLPFLSRDGQQVTEQFVGRCQAFARLRGQGCGTRGKEPTTDERPLRTARWH